jgi:hypothetical protein
MALSNQSLGSNALRSSRQVAFAYAQGECSSSQHHLQQQLLTASVSLLPLSPSIEQGIHSVGRSTDPLK